MPVATPLVGVPSSYLLTGAWTNRKRDTHKGRRYYLAFFEVVLQCQHRSLQLRLPYSNGQIAARLFEDAARGICGAAQPARDGVWIIDGNQQRVDIVHAAQQRLARIVVALSQLVQYVATQFSHRLA